MKPTKAKMSGAPLLSRALLFSLVWWILTDGAASSWFVGVPAVLLALIAGAALVPPVPFLWHELLRFVPWFLMHSLLGGVDVARRAFHPGMPIAPDLIEYPLRLPPGLPRVFMANTVSLLPGTLSAALDRSVLTVHVLDRRTGFLADLAAVEHSVARIFGTSLKVAERGE